MSPARHPRRIRVERGVYRQPNGNYAVCARRAGRLKNFRTLGRDLAAARRAREELISALTAGRVPASPRLRFDTVAGWWLERASRRRSPPASDIRERSRPTATTSITTCCRALPRGGSPHLGSRTWRR